MEKYKTQIEYEAKDWKEAKRIDNTLKYVVKNYKELEPLIKQYWLKKEREKLDKER